MTSAPTRSASSTSAAPGLRVRIRPVWILMPARRAWMRALSSTERPCASSSSRPASSESWLGTGSTKIAYTTPSSPISLAALCSALRADVVAEDRHQRGAVVERLEVGRALRALDLVGLARVQALAAAVDEVAGHPQRPSTGCRSCAPRRAARRPRTTPRTCRCAPSTAVSGIARPRMRHVPGHPVGALAVGLLDRAARRPRRARS